MDEVMIGLLIFIGVCSLLGIWGYTFTRKRQKEIGIYPMGGINGANASKFIRSNPTVSTVYDLVKSGGATEQNIQKILQAGAKAVITSKFEFGMLVLMEDAAIAFGDTGDRDAGAEGQLITPMRKCSALIKREEIKVRVEAGTETTQGKGKSVIGSAVVGSVLAGGVGAVVGAIAAANHNTNNKEITITKYETIGTGIEKAYLKFDLCKGRLPLDNIYVADDVNVKVSSVYQAVNDIIGIIDKKDYGKATTNAEEDGQDDEDLEWLSGEIIKEYLAEHPKSTVQMIIDGCPELEIGLRDVSRLLRKFTLEGEVKRTEDRQYAYFELTK